MPNDNLDSELIINAPQYALGKQWQEFIKRIRQKIEEGTRQVVIDMQETESMDSSSIGHLVLLCKDLTAVGGNLAIRNLQGSLKELFELTGLDRVFTIQTGGETKAAQPFFAEGAVDICLDIKEEEAGQVKIMRLSGIMNHPVGSNFFKSRFLLTLATHRKILLDFEDLTYLDSGSVGILLNMYRLLAETGGSMRLCCSNCIVRDVLSTLNVDRSIPFYDQRDRALENWQ